ncbi:MAG: hypothetical protein HC828_03265 [Blastochloris sp.]|nr:hypothetical protein [Blastochloris sp.]
MGRSQRAPSEDWEQLQLLCTSPEQQRYEELRPLVLHQQTPASCSRETGTPAYTLRRRAARFAARGMASLFTSPPMLPTTTPQLPQALPAELKQLILDLKVEHPPLRVHEIGTICYAQTGRRPDAKTIKRVLQAADPLPPRQTRRFAPIITFLIPPAAGSRSYASIWKGGPNAPLRGILKPAEKPCTRPSGAMSLRALLD